MNKRQKKKLYKNSLIKIKKFHPKQGDVVCLIPNFEEIDLGTIVDFLNVCAKEKVFGDTSIVIVPCNISVEDKNTAEMILEKLLSKLREGGE